MNEYINLSLENIEKEHICCAIGDAKHQKGVNRKKEWMRGKFSDGLVFRKLNAKGKIFIQYEPVETAWVPISGKKYEYIYCLWVAGSYKGKGFAHELLTYAINDAKEKGMSGICTLTSKKKKPFIGEKKFFMHYGFEIADSIGEYELLRVISYLLRNYLPRLFFQCTKFRFRILLHLLHPCLTLQHRRSMLLNPCLLFLQECLDVSLLHPLRCTDHDSAVRLYLACD